MKQTFAQRYRFRVTHNADDFHGITFEKSEAPATSAEQNEDRRSS